MATLALPSSLKRSSFAHASSSRTRDQLKPVFRWARDRKAVFNRAHVGCFIARTSGWGVEVEGPSDSGSKYLKQILSFMGFTHIEVCG